MVEPRLERAAEENEAGMLGGVQTTPACARPDGMGCWVVIPAGAGMACVNHWIPACAGMTVKVGFRFVPE